MVNKFIKVSGYMINIEKSAYFYTPAMNNMKIKLRKESYLQPYHEKMLNITSH